MVGPAHLYKFPMVGPQEDWEEGKYPTHGTRSKFYFNNLSKKKIYRRSFQGFFSWFLKHHFVFNYNYYAIQNWFQNVGFFIVFN